QFPLLFSDAGVPLPARDHASRTSNRSAGLNGRQGNQVSLALGCFPPHLRRTPPERTMMKGLWPRLVAVCAVLAPVAQPGPGRRHLSLFGPREDLPWHRHDALWQLTGSEFTWNKPKPRKDEKPLSQEAYVTPQRPGKNLVRYFDFHWRDFDFL